MSMFICIYGMMLKGQTLNERNIFNGAKVSCIRQCEQYFIRVYSNFWHYSFSALTGTPCQFFFHGDHANHTTNVHTQCLTHHHCYVHVLNMSQYVYFNVSIISY